MHFLKASLYLIFLTLTGSQFTFAQSIDSIAGTPDFMGYESIPMLCNGTSYLGATTWSSPSADPAGFCESVENDQFICFQTANSTMAVFEFSLASCAGNGSGVEVGVVDRDGNSVGTCIYVDDPAGEERLELTGLDPLTEYCLRIDGIQGANCDFIFTPVSGVTSDAPRQPMVLSSTVEYCYGEAVDLFVERIPNATGYFWQTRNVGGLRGAFYIGADGNRISGFTPVQDSIVSLVLPNLDITRMPGSCDTIYSSVSAINACGVSDESEELVFVLCTSAVDSVTLTTCNADSVGVEYPTGSGNLFFPNGGTYQSALITSGDCGDVTAVLRIEGVGSSPVLEVDTTVCFFPVVLRGDTIRSEGIYEYYFPLANSQCDSVVSYTIRSPSAQGAALDNPYCTNEFVRVGNSPWDNNFTYTWTDDQGNLAGDTPNDYLNQFEDPGIYTLTVSHAGCEFLLDVVVALAPEVEIIVDSDFLTVIADGGADSVALYINGAFEVGNRSQIFFQGLSNYTDSVSFLACAFSDCGRTCEFITLDSISSAQHIPSISDLQVWPNPSTGVFNLRLDSDHNAIVEVYNLVGKRLVAQELYASQQIDLTQQPSGIYWITLIDVVTGLPFARSQVVKQ